MNGAHRPAYVRRGPAGGVNGAIWWITLAGFSLYWLINAGFYVWLCAQHARYVMRRRAALIS